MRQLKSPKFTSLISLIAISIAASTACAPAPRTPVNDELPVEKVVIYRNGVAYYERGGDVSDESIEFRMRTANMADFLGSMAILDESGGALRSASFPIELEEEDLEIVPSPQDEPQPEPVKKKKQSDVRSVKLHLDGKKHHLKVGYIAESPVWKPSYRVVFGKDGKALLQVWGIVQNLSGSDWNHVKLSLVGGTPISFRSDLGTPVIPYRPEVTDQGEVVAYVPPSRNSAMSKEEEASYDDMAEESEEEAPIPRSSPAKKLTSMAKSASAPMGVGGDDDEGYGYSFSERAAPAPAPAQWSNQSRATASSLGDNTSSTRFELDEGVTVPNGSSTMVLLAALPVPGEHYFLYSPESMDAQSQIHPYHVARFANGSPAALERGNVSVYDDKDFLGQGLMSALGKGRSTTIPFAQERGIDVKLTDTYHQTWGRVARISRGRIQLKREDVKTVTYTVNSKLAADQKVVIRHQYSGSIELLDIPKATEKVDNEYAALIPMKAVAQKDTVLKFRELRKVEHYLDWAQIDTIVALKNLLADPIESKVLSAVEKKSLEEVVKYIEEVNSLHQAVQPLTVKSRELSQAKRELESSIIAIEKNGRAADLRQELTTKLGKYSRELEEAQRLLIDKNTRIRELEIRIKQLVEQIDYEYHESSSEAGVNPPIEEEPLPIK